MLKRVLGLEMKNFQPVGRWALNLGFFVLAVVLALTLAQAGLSFGQQLLVAVLLIVAGSQLSKLTSKSLPDFHWPVLAKGTGWVFLVAVLVNSNFVQKPLEVINVANENLGEVDVRSVSLQCPPAYTGNDRAIFLRRGCTTQITGFPDRGEFQPTDARFSKALTEYVEIEQPWKGYVTLRPHDGFPPDIAEVEVLIVVPNER